MPQTTPESMTVNGSDPGRDGTPAALEIQGLVFSYPARDGEPAFDLRVPSLRVEQGEQVLLSAPSGRGKSTLLNLIAGLMDPAGGRVLVAGEAVHDLRGAARDAFRGRRIGMIFQVFNLLQGFTAAENVMAALMFSDIPSKEHGARALGLLAALGIDRPHQAVERLSTGQQQRVAVARAVACDPVLVLADEPTASLDPTSAAASMDLIQGACAARNVALLCVSHDPAMAERFARRENLADLVAGSARA